MSAMPEDFFADLHALATQAHTFLERVYISGDGNPMPTVEANAVGHEKAITGAAETIGSGLSDVATALHRIADEMAAQRRMKMGMSG